MKIGLVRHFKVNKESPTGPIASEDFSSFMEDYDQAEVTACQVDLRNIDWQHCYASDLYRAQKTAASIFDGQVEVDRAIREVDMRFKESLEGNYLYHEWAFYSWNAWKDDSESVMEGISDSRKRISDFLDRLLEEKDQEAKILLVCHGLIMRVLEEELLKRDFEGDKIIFPSNGDLYLYEK